MLRKHPARPRRKRGLVIVQVVVMLTVLLGCVAFAVDVGYIYDLRGEMQSAVDASSLAGASGLRNGNGAAKQRAADYAARNYVARHSIKPGELQITIGNWNGLTATFVPASGNDPATPNAIRVVGQRANIPLFFAGILGDTSTDVAKFATAVQGGGHCLGIWGLEGVFGEGDIVTDSYDYRMGGYGSGNVHANGDICSCSDITLDGGVSIRGDAIYGEDNSIIISGNSYEIVGVVDDQPCALQPPTFDMAEAATNNDNASIPLTDRGRDPFNGTQWDFYVTGSDNLTLPPGKFYFTSAMLDGQATLTITGPTEIYISGDATFTGGGIINQTQDPTNLKIYMTGSTAVLSGSAGFYGGVVAPQTDIQLVGTSSFYGVMVGRTLDFDGTANVHVEESLVADLFGLESVSPILVE